MKKNSDEAFFVVVFFKQFTFMILISAGCFWRLRFIFPTAE